MARVVPAGWYDDPASPRTVRWWNGIAWTAHVAPKPERPSHPTGVSASPVPVPPAPPRPGATGPHPPASR